MRNRTSAVISGLGIIAVLVALTPDPVAARGGGRGAGVGVRGHGFAGRGVVATGGFRRAAVVRPGWGAGVRPGWAGRRVAAGASLSEAPVGVGAAVGVEVGVEVGAGPLRPASRSVSLRPVLGAGVATVRDGTAFAG